MVEDLKAVNRSATPWVIVGGHRPMYIDSTNYAPVQGDQTVAAELRAALEQDFIKYEVRCGAVRAEQAQRRCSKAAEAVAVRPLEAVGHSSRRGRVISGSSRSAARAPVTRWRASELLPAF